MLEPQVMTVQQVAHYLHVHPNTIYRMARKGKLPAFKVGSDWRFNRESIDRWRMEQEGAQRRKTEVTVAPASFPSLRATRG